MDTIKLLIDGAAGIYVPRNFYEHYDLPTWGLDVSQFSDLSDPDKEHYWDAWDEALRDAKYTDDEGHTWTLHQDDSLFAVRDDHVFEE